MTYLIALAWKSAIQSNFSGNGPCEAGGEPRRDRRPRRGASVLRGGSEAVRSRRFGRVRANRRGNQYSHECIASTNPPISPRAGGRAISQLEGWRMVRIAPRSVQRTRIGADDRGAAPSTTKGEIRTNATPFASNGAMGSPLRDQKITI